MNGSSICIPWPKKYHASTFGIYYSISFCIPIFILKCLKIFLSNYSRTVIYSNAWFHNDMPWCLSLLFLISFNPKIYNFLSRKFSITSWIIPLPYVLFCLDSILGNLMVKSQCWFSTLLPPTLITLILEHFPQIFSNS